MLNIYITIVLLCLNLAFSKSKISCLVLFLFMWSLWGWNTWNGDYDLYQEAFDNSKALTKEIGFSYFNYLFKSIGFSFQSFLILSSGLLLFSIYWLAIRYSPYPGLFAFLYFPVFLQGYVYLRNYFLWVIILFGLLKSLETQRPKFAYIVSVLLSVAFHSSGLLYFLFLPGISRDRLKASRIIITSIVLFVATYIFFNYITSIIGNTSYSSSLDYYGNGIHFGASIIFHFLFILFFLFIDAQINKKALFSENERYITNVVFNFNVLSLFLLPVYIIIPYLPNRFVCFLVLVNMFYLMCAIKYSLKKKRVVIYSFSYYISLCSVSLAMLYVSTLPYTIIPLYMCNMIWGDNYTLHNLNVINYF